VTHTPRRRFAQHFLDAEAVLEQMAARLGYRATDRVVEIGPGEGALTQYLLAAGADVTAIEIDRDLATSLRQRFATLRVIEADVLKVDLEPLLGPDLRIVGNLPYNISTPLLVRLLELLPRLADMHFLLQSEVVARLAARPGTKAWGRLGVLAQYGAVVEPLFDVPPESFRPPPQVNSTFVRITPRRDPLPLHSREQLVDVVRLAFQQRRKTLRNALQSLDVDWSRAPVAPETRADAVDVAGFVSIANGLVERAR